MLGYKKLQSLAGQYYSSTYITVYSSKSNTPLIVGVVGSAELIHSKGDVLLL